MYVYMGCSSRQVQKGFELANLLFCNIVGKVPSHQVVLDWVIKCGFSVSKEDNEKYSLSEVNGKLEKGYSLIIDNSIGNSNQEIHLELACPSKYPGHPLTSSDVQVVNVEVGKKWDGDKVKECLSETKARLDGNLDYVTSDNGRNLGRACRDISIPQHHDISHTFGVYLQRVYEKDSEYKAFCNGISNARKYLHTEICGILPPAQRSIARFMNEFERVDWARAVRDNLFLLPPRAEFVFGFVERMGAFIDEMAEVMDWYRYLLKLCKENGLSRKTAKECRRYIHEHFIVGVERQRQLGELLIAYFNQEESLLESDDAVHNICTDIIESTFGSFKFRIIQNHYSGFTPLVLLIPLHMKVADIKDCETFSVKERMENTRYADINKFKKERMCQDTCAHGAKDYLKTIGF